MDRLKHWSHRLVMLALVAVLLVVAAYSFPVDAALLFAVDASLYIEAAVTMFVAAQVVRIRPMLVLARAWLYAAYGRMMGRTALRGVTPPGRREKLRADNDDEDGPVVIFMAA